MCKLKKRLKNVAARIRQAEIDFNRKTKSVRLLAVSKTKPIIAIEQAIKYGQLEFGENYLQDALQKIKAIDNKKVKWHFIGSIQSNKAKLIAQNFSWVHTVGNLKIANKLDKFRPDSMEPLNICIQVNTSLETSKAGCTLEEVSQLAGQISKFKNLKLRGLMAIPKAHTDFSKQRESFARLTSMFDELIDQGFELDTLSIGMSGDLEAAIAQGSTMVRIGTDIFGART